MSEPINVDKRLPPERANVDPYRIELPPNLVTARMVPHHLATEGGALIKTGKLEVRIENPITKKDAKKTVDWHATAMNCAHQTAYYKQVYDNVVMRAEEAERKYTEAVVNNSRLIRDAAQDKPIVSAAFGLCNWWGFFLLPKFMKRAIRPV